MFGFLTELWSRPHRDPETGRFDMTRWTGDAALVRPGEPYTKLSTEEVCQRALQQSRRRMNYLVRMIPHVLGIFPYVAMWVIIVSSARIEPSVARALTPAANAQLNNFFVQLDDLRIADEDIYERIPDFVPWAVVGSMVIFSLFTFPQW